MSRLRVLCFLAGLAVGAALLLCDWAWLSAVAAALGPGDALLGALGLVLAVMTGAAGVLIAADVRADMATAHAWHEIHAEPVVIATPAEAAPTDQVNARYADGPQDEGLRRILLAQRFMVPVPLNGIEALAPARGDARAVTQPMGPAIKPELQAVRTVSVADGHGERVTAPATAQRNLGLQLISSNAMSAGGRKRHYSVRKASAPKCVANAGKRWDGPVFITAATSHVTRSSFGCDEIVLTDRNGRSEGPAPSDVAPEPKTTVQPCCRGPPRGTFRQHVADRPANPGKPFRETDRSRANPPADFVVIDNLRNGVPVCEAELQVLEAYLEDVLDDVLGSDAPAIKPT